MHQTPGQFLTHQSWTLCQTRLFSCDISLHPSVKFSLITSCANSGKYGRPSTTWPPHLSFLQPHTGWTPEGLLSLPRPESQKPACPTPVWTNLPSLPPTESSHQVHPFQKARLGMLLSRSPLQMSPPQHTSCGLLHPRATYHWQSQVGPGSLPVFPSMVPGARRNAQSNTSTPEHPGDLSQMTYLLHIQLSP